MPRLLYIGQAPAEGTGSPVIILRHLQRLAAAGWEIVLITEGFQPAPGEPGKNWTVRTLPLRRLWWPPFRPDSRASRSLRTWLLARECDRLMGGHPPDAVLGYLAAHDDFHTEIAARYARISGRPLTLLVHDDAAAFVDANDRVARARLAQRHAWILRRAHRCWFVSPELAAVHPLPAFARRVLPPIPATRVSGANWRPAFARRPRIYYAGFVWPAQFSLLRTLAQTFAEAGAELVLLTRATPELTAFLATAPATHVAPFPTNREALDHLAADAAGLLVAYAETVETMPWIATSFPSKLVEYAQLGLPCAVVAPRESAVGGWAQQHPAVDFFTTGDARGLTAWARDLSSEKNWLRRGEAARELARGEFNPDAIQSVFAAGLLRS